MFKILRIFLLIVPFLCEAAVAVPEFAVTAKSTGSLLVYSKYTQINSTQYSAEDTVVRAVVTNLGNDLWKLEILAKQDLSQLFFPWQSQRVPLDADISDDIFYYPLILGVTEKATARNVDGNWFGVTYPGGALAPLVVMADSNDAMIVAATNWPAKRVTPLYAAQRMILRYDDTLNANTSAVYQALITAVKANSSPGTFPWQLAVDRYRSWFDTKAPPVTYPSWMWNGHGFLNIELQNYPVFNISDVNNVWQAFRSTLPWVLFWGQMSTYTALGGSCCALKQTMDLRYQPDLINFVKNTVANGDHAGYYSVPYYGTSSSDPARLLDTPAGVNWLTSWIAANQGYGANSYYIDTLGRLYWGDPAKVLDLFNQGAIPVGSLIEGSVDIYPAAGLMSGNLVGDNVLCGAPYKTPENSTATTFPRFGRYILKERLLYTGESNTDWRFWGSGKDWLVTADWEGGLNTKCAYSAYCASNGPCEYGTERNAFLLGAKLDVIRPGNNPIFNAITQEWQRVNWWNRRPVYLDTKDLDLRTIPASSRVELRHFQDINGIALIAISNPNQVSALTFRLNGKPVSVPTQPISIVEVR